jgi:hypothetical protein
MYVGARFCDELYFGREILGKVIPDGIVALVGVMSIEYR